MPATSRRARSGAALADRSQWLALEVEQDPSTVRHVEHLPEVIVAVDPLQHRGNPPTRPTGRWDRPDSGSMPAKSSTWLHAQSARMRKAWISSEAAGRRGGLGGQGLGEVRCTSAVACPRV